MNDEFWTATTLGQAQTPWGSQILGISEQIGLGNLTLTRTAQQRILYGNGPLPGIINDTNSDGYFEEN